MSKNGCKSTVSYPLEWIKLDHSANIYPATMNRRLAAMFRLSVTLRDSVDPAVLQSALDETMPRFPSFGVRLRKGFFWNYLEQVYEKPTVQADAINPMISITADRKQQFLFRIRYHHRQIALEAFHALTDGTGGLTFLMTLVAVYLHKKQNMPMEAGRYVLDINTPSEQEELEDSFPRYRGEFGQMAKETRAYHPRGTLIASHLLLVITGVMSVDDVRRKAEKYSCSITVFLTALMIFALQKQQEMERRKKKPIRISVPVNLRTRFPSKTLRNFSYWINPGINMQYGHYTLDEIIRLVQAHLQIGLDPKQLCARFTGTLSAAEHPLFRAIPLFLKHWILNVGDVLMGDASCSQSLSNLGSVDVPDPMKPYLCDVRFLLGRSRGKAGSGSCVSYHDKLALSFTRKIHESAFERLFFSSLVEMGIPVEIESNRLR